MADYNFRSIARKGIQSLVSVTEHGIPTLRPFLRDGSVRSDAWHNWVIRKNREELRSDALLDPQKCLNTGLEVFRVLAVLWGFGH